MTRSKDMPAASPAPAAFRFSFHNAWHMPHVSVEWMPEQRRLRVSKGIGMFTEHTVSDRRWRAFWRKAKAMGIWVWPRDFEEPYGSITMDGHGWSLEVDHLGLRLETGGTNAYPPGPDDTGTHGSVGPQGYTHGFARLLRAVRALHAET